MRNKRWLPAVTALAIAVVFPGIAAANTDSDHDDHTGLPAAEAVAQPAGEGSKEYFHSVVGDLVFFDYDRYALNAAAKAALDKQIVWLKRFPEYDIRLQGHTDEHCQRLYCLALGERLAGSVRSYMAAQGLPTQRITVISYGRERPIDPGHGKASQARNRRVETMLIDRAR